MTFATTKYSGLDQMLSQKLEFIKKNAKIYKELENNQVILSEGLQTILRDIGCPNPYEILRKITQSNHNLKYTEIQDKLFDELKKLQDKDIINITPDIIQKITTLSCFNYIGSF